MCCLAVTTLLLVLCIVPVICALHRCSNQFNCTDKSGGLVQEQYEKNMHGMIGSLFDPSEEEDIPLLYFHSFASLFKWICSWAIPGLGMFSEAYFVFSIGNIKPILADQYPQCWSKYKVLLWTSCYLHSYWMLCT